MNKKDIRKILIEKRNAVFDKAQKSGAIETALLPLIESYNVIGLFYSMENEVNTLPIISTLLDRGKTVALPVIRGGVIDFYKIDCVDGVIDSGGKYKIKEPKPIKDNLIKPQEIQVMVCPGVGFDLNFNRLGYGGGYYDKYLLTLSVFKIGICFDCQLTDDIPEEKNDVKMDCIVTEKRIIKK